MPLTDKDRQFLTHHYATYYKEEFKTNFYLTALEDREFAFDIWNPCYGRRPFERHIDFPREELLDNYLKDFVPRHFYTSAARYEMPGEPSMREKGWKDNRETNCDLIFDLDIDHIFTNCKKVHDKWVCKACGQIGRGPAPSSCPRIGCVSTSFKELTWECPKCMEVAKQQIIYLIEEFLTNDFGLNPNDSKEIFITFSGRRGYHVHVENERMRYLTSNARRELIDYISGLNINPEFLGLKMGAKQLPNKSDRGWRGRMTRLTLQYMREATEAELRQFFRRKRKEIPTIRENMINDLNSDNPTWNYSEVGKRTLYNIIQTAIAKYVPKLDKPVTTDTHRLIRTPGSLHGKTGFLVKRLSFKELESFNPYTDAQVFRGTVRVYIKEAPAFTLGGQDFGPYKDQATLLPLSAAIFLMSREMATISK
ncbi:MAG: DNA primase small subunit domain-containing protein [Candidatus Thorarchaeota archaeon]